MIRICENCKKDFNVYPSQVKLRGGKFCSRACYDGYRSEFKICQVCGKDFKLGREHKKSSLCCSNECRLANERLKKGIIKICKHCGNNFRTTESRNRKFCSKTCADLNKTLDTSTGYTREFYNIRNHIIKLYNEKCLICGKLANNVHHVDYNKLNNSEINLVILCSSCHAKSNFDRNFWEERLWKIIGCW